MSIEDKLQSIKQRFVEIDSKLSSGDIKPEEIMDLGKERSELEPLVLIINELDDTKQAIADAEEMLQDPEMKELAEAEMQEAKQQLPDIEKRLKVALLPKDAADERNAILEVRAGAGGDEAGLFAAEIFRAYAKYADSKGWKFEIMSISESGIGAYKDATASISGQGVFARLKYESGVHRVQRVPATESGGRIHTSTITVAVLPEAEEVDLQINDSDLRIDVFRASGPGGQSVNTTDSAVRIVHIPTGLIVSQQDEKSQHKNKAKAMKVMRARLYDLERQKVHDARSADRKGQVGTGDRSERIRTYNFPQSRLTDHRINFSVSNLTGVMEGQFEDLVDKLISEDQAARMAEIE